MTVQLLKTIIMDVVTSWLIMSVCGSVYGLFGQLDLFTNELMRSTNNFLLKQFVQRQVEEFHLLAYKS